MNIRIKKIVLIVATIFCIAGVSVANDETSRDEKNTDITIAGGHPFGIRYALSGAICNFINKQRKYTCQVLPTDNSGDGIALMRAGKADFAILQSDWLEHAKDGTSRFSDIGKDRNIRSVATFNGESVFIVVNNDAQIKSVRDFKKSRIDVGMQGTYRNILMRILLKVNRLDSEDIKEINVSQDVAIKYLCSGKLDAGLFVVSTPNSAMDKMLSQCNVSVLSVSDKARSKMKKDLKGFYDMYIPAETYHNQGNAIETIGLYSVLVSDKDTDKAIVAHLYSTILENIEQLSQMHPALANINKDSIEVLTGVSRHESINNE